MSRVEHWESVYATHATHDLSRYQAKPETSLQLIAKLGIGLEDPIIDVGGGASNPVDHLLEDGSKLSESLRETHVTREQGQQNFIDCCFRRC